MPTQKQKIKMYEKVLHELYYNSSVILNDQGVMKLLDNIARWSYSFRDGNGTLSEKEVNRNINNAFNRLLEK